MAAGALARWPGRIEHALVVRRAPAPRGVELPGERRPVRVAAHPIPDARSVAAADEALRLAAASGPSDLLLALVSGGASALLAAPPEGLDLAGKQAIVAAPARSRRADPRREPRAASPLKGQRWAARARGRRRAGAHAARERRGGGCAARRRLGADGAGIRRRSRRRARCWKRRASHAPPGLVESVKPGEIRARARVLADPRRVRRGRRGGARAAGPPRHRRRARRGRRARPRRSPRRARPRARAGRSGGNRLRADAALARGARPRWPRRLGRAGRDASGYPRASPCCARRPTASTGARARPGRSSRGATPSGPAPATIEAALAAFDDAVRARGAGHAPARRAHGAQPHRRSRRRAASGVGAVPG